MRKNFRVLFGVCFFLAIFGVNIYAQKPPDAGVILRETEKYAPEQRPQGPVFYTPEKAKKGKKGQTIFVKGFRFTGAKILPDVELKKLLEGFVGRNVDIIELNTATSIIAEYYVKKGYVVKALIPPQEIKNGIVEIRIIIGHLEGYTTTGEKKTRFNQETALRIINNAQNDKKIIKIDRLERGLLILNDIPGVQATSYLRPGKEEGGVLVDIDVKDEPLLSGNIGYDDYGIHSTGIQRGTLGLSLNDPFSIGDQINGNFIYTGLTNYESLAYSLPIGYSGMRAGLTSSYLHYRLGKEFSDTHGKGYAFTIGPYISYPLVRSRSKNAYLFMSFHHKKFFNELLGEPISNKITDVGSIYINADAYDQYFSGGYTMGGLGFSLGNLNLRGCKSDFDADQNGPKANGFYRKFIFLISRIQRVTEKTSLNLKASGQVAFDNLDSSEQFSLGGPDGVRAYSSGDVNGDHGFIANVELARELGRGFKITGFYDLGYIVRHFKTYAGWQTTAGQKNGYALDSVGVGLGWAPKKWFSAKVFAAAAAMLRNSDISNTQDFSAGIGRNSRVWLQVTATF